MGHVPAGSTGSPAPTTPTAVPPGRSRRRTALIALSIAGGVLSLGALLTIVWLQASSVDGPADQGADAARLLADAPDAAFEARVDQRVAAAMAEQGVVGLGCAVLYNGQIVYQKGFGDEDREAGVPVTASTRFRWASISKPLTAVRVMQLWEQGELDLDADIRAYVPEFPEKPFPITARQLLCHQGGIVHYSNGKVIRTRRKYSDPHPFRDQVVALDDFKASPLIAEPGTRYSYSTRGFMLLGAVIQKVGGAPYAEQIRDHVAAPLGMTTLRPDYQWEKIPHRARGYRHLPGKLATVPSGNSDVSWKLPGGGFISTVSDLARFGGGLLESALVRPETRRAMWTRQATRAGKRASYGLGFHVERFEGALLAGHSGAQQKAATLLLISPHGRAAVALMSNTEGTKLWGLGRDLIRLLRSATRLPAPAAAGR